MVNEHLSEDLLKEIIDNHDKLLDHDPRLSTDATQESQRRAEDLEALLDVSLTLNSSLDVDAVLDRVMRNAIGLMKAQRGLVMLLDDNGELQVRSAYNLCREEMMEEDFRISSSITSQVAATGRSVFTSDAQSDNRFSAAKSVVELNLRSIMCVPVMLKGTVIGVIYLDSSDRGKVFLKSDLYLFELYAQLVAIALNNARTFEQTERLKSYHQSVVANSPTGIVVMDNDTRIASINAIALEILDLDREKIRLLHQDLSPTSLLDLIPESERSRWQQMLATVVTTQEPHTHPRHYHNTGYLEKVLSIKIAPTDRLSDGSSGLIMALEDVTEKVTMEQYVILSEKLVARGEMAATVAHELNNYLSIIANNAELLSLNVDRSKFDKAKHNTSAIVDHVFKVKRFVDSLMDFSNPEPEYIAYDLRRLIDDLLFSLRIQPRLKLIQFSIDMANDLPSLEIDVGQVQQVLMNLLNNAADAIEERAVHESENGEDTEFAREIGIRADYDSEADEISVAVTDNGVGMSKETLAKIFTLHFSTKKGGHGLGLYNCQKIVDQHGGKLTAESTLGEGTTFTLTLPRFHTGIDSPDEP